MYNNIHSFKKFKKIPIIISIIFLIFSCSIFFFLYKKVGDNKKNAEEMQTKWYIEEIVRDEIKSLDRSILNTEKERNLLESHFVQGSDVVPFLDKIEQLALAVKIKSEIISVDIPKDKKGLLVSVKVTGGFESIYKYLSLMENSPYELEFISADIKNLNTQAILGKSNIIPQWEAVFKIQLLSFVQ